MTDMLRVERRASLKATAMSDVLRSQRHVDDAVVMTSPVIHLAIKGAVMSDASSEDGRQ